MKRIVFFLLVVFSFGLANAQNTKRDVFKVYGNCAVCKKRIETAIKADVQSANWDPQTKLLEVSYDASKIKNKKIQQKIAAVGHDTEKVRANDKVYADLPSCCRYARKVEDHTTHEMQGGHMHHRK